MMPRGIIKPKSSRSGEILGKAKKKIRSKAFILCSLMAIVGYSMMSNIDAEQRARELLEARERYLITKDLGGGDCDIGSPVDDAPNKPGKNTTRTLLASYPGSGKRFTWAVIKALTNYEVADDWNFSGKLYSKPLTIKTSWPHHEGKWSWGNQMDQTLLLIRNPRRAIPSYHTMRWELDYATTWMQSYARIPDTYRERPTVKQWEKWRDRAAIWQADAWFDFYDFWMQSGFMEDKNETHFRCLWSEIDCQPVELVDFENLYTGDPTDDFRKIGSVLDNARDVDVIAAQARDCVLFHVYNRTEHSGLNLHQASRPNPNITEEYIFLLPQFDRIMNRTIELRNKYSYGIQDHTNYTLNSTLHSDVLVNIVNRYIGENTAEFFDSVDIFLDEYVIFEFEIEVDVPADDSIDPPPVECVDLNATETIVCNFMKDKNNHDIFFDGFYPDDFPYPDWLNVSI